MWLSKEVQCASPLVVVVACAARALLFASPRAGASLLLARARAGLSLRVVLIVSEPCARAAFQAAGFVGNRIGQSDGVSHLAHLFGAIVGAVWGFLLSHPEQKKGIWHKLANKANWRVKAKTVGLWSKAQ